MPFFSFQSSFSKKIKLFFPTENLLSGDKKNSRQLFVPGGEKKLFTSLQKEGVGNQVAVFAPEFQMKIGRICILAHIKGPFQRQGPCGEHFA